MNKNSQTNIPTPIYAYTIISYNKGVIYKGK